MALFVLALAGGNAFADTTWNGTTDDWSVGANWDNGVPAGTAVANGSEPINGNAILPTGSAYTVSLTGGGTTNNLTLDSGATLDVSSALVTTGVNETTPLGNLRLNNGSTLNLNTGGSASIGAEVRVFDTATLTINTGTSLTFSERVFNHAFSLNGTVNVHGTLSGTTNVPYSGNQTIGISRFNTTGDATMNIDAGSVTANTLNVGGGIVSGVGRGVLNISNGGTLTIRDGSNSNGITLGDLTNGNASVFTNSATINLTDGTITNGSLSKLQLLGISIRTADTDASGTAAVNVSGGTFNQFGTTYIGSGRNGSLNVSGTGTFTSAGDILAGGTGNQYSAAPTGGATASGAITVIGGTLTAANIKVGDGDFSVLGGSNTAWSSAGSFTLSGGTVNVTGLTATNGANSTITFNGGTLNTAGTTIANGSTFTVGNGSSPAMLKLDGGSHSFANGITLANNSTLGGTGTITSGTLIVSSGATLSPGNSPGTITAGATTLEGGGNYNWQILDANGAAGTGYDTMSLTSGNALTLNNTSANPFNINLWSLSSIGPDVNGDATNFNNASNYSWTLISTDQLISGFSADKFAINVGAINGTGGFTNALSGGSFSVSLGDSNTDLLLNYNAVPEPSSLLLLGMGIVGLALLRRRPVENNND